MGVNLIKAFLKANFKSFIEYRHEFILSSISMIINNLVLFGGLYLVLSKILPGTLYFQGITIFMGAYALGVAFFGMVNLGHEIVYGTFDKLLIRPRSTYILLLINEISNNAIGELLTWIIFMTMVADKLYIFIWTLISAIFLHIVILFYETLHFFIKTNYPMYISSMAMDTGLYPPQMFPKVVKKWVIFLFPGTLISFGPILALSDPRWYIYYFIAFIFFVIMTMISWKVGLKRYESVGY